MSRSNYADDYENNWAMIKWAGQVKSSIRGKRGQQFLKDLLSALDAMPEKRLIGDELQTPEGVCAIGSLGVARGIALEKLDPENYDAIAKEFGIASPLVRELEYVNDEHAYRPTPERRWEIVREWVVENIRREP